MKRWVGNLLLFFGSLLFVFIILEILLRVLGISYPSFYQYDKDLGSSLRPSAQGLWTKEGRAYIKISSHGLRDREHSYKKQKNTFRIAVIGDSYAEAFQISMEKTFWHILEQKLQKCRSLNGKKVEVINFGISGYGTGRELIQLRKRVWKYNPDLVILAFLTGNDIRNNLRELEQDDSLPYVLYKKRQFVIDNSFRKIANENGRGRFSKIKNLLTDYSNVFQLLNEARIRIKQKNKIDKQINQSEGTSFGENGLDNLIYKEPRQKAWKRAWFITERLLLQIKKEVKERGADLLVVSLTNGIQVHPRDKEQKNFIRKIGVKNLLYPDLRVKEFAERNGIEILSLVKPFEAYAKKHNIYLHGFENLGIGGGHWNENGHKLAGKMISEKICSAILRNNNEGKREQ